MMNSRTNGNKNNRGKMEVKTIKKDKIYEVENNGKKYSVVFQVRKGRTLLLCSCTNGTLFINEPTICKHR